ncbi:MAG TPA: hypothetical protein VNS58_09065 [Puia sp.]|nr:hypothetical protein [Puia sp.]
MKLHNHELYRFFIEKNIPYLYHANTIGTAMTFMQVGGLLSRGEVENRKLFQTYQSSDEKDKTVGVWNDIFLDTIDLHGHFPWQNVYGPLSFEISIEFMLHYDFDIWITKNNPQYWNPTLSLKERYFTSVMDLSVNWDNYERQRKMVTIRSANEPILFDYIKAVVVDNPNIELAGKSVLKEATKGLKTALNGDEDFKKKFTVRKCENCYCKAYYSTYREYKLKRAFLEWS